MEGKFQGNSEINFFLKFIVTVKKLLNKFLISKFEILVLFSER